MHLSFNTEGRNRWVFLTRRYAFKFPAPTSWRNFLFGLLNNQNEWMWQGEDERYCPTVFHVWGGWLNIMPRARNIDQATLIELLSADFIFPPGVELKPSSFGTLTDEYCTRIVAVDYGWR